MVITITLTLPAAAAEGQHKLLPLGFTAGIKLSAEGVLIVDTPGVDDRNPAVEAGLYKGDVIREVDSKKITNTIQLKEALSSGKSVELTVEREDKLLKISAQPVQDSEGSYRLGAYVRDSIAGMGTLTWYDPETGVFGALGHGISDSDSSALMPMGSGSLVHSSVSGVRKGEVGKPGELCGNFDLKDEYGSLYSNTQYGIFGEIDRKVLKCDRDCIPIAEPTEVVAGEATILSNVAGEQVEEYSIKILKAQKDNASSPRDMLIQITDQRLLERTGGIVQGMSGSPIIQNGKLVGAVTHVLINDPARGYGIYVENMLEAAEVIS